jgi:hypothetical protein
MVERGIPIVFDRGMEEGETSETSKEALKLVDVKWEQGRGDGQLAPLIAVFEYTNKTDQAILLQFDKSDIVATDNNGESVECDFYNGSNPRDEISQSVDANRKLNFSAMCGKGGVPEEVTKYEIRTNIGSINTTWTASPR